MTRPAGVTAVAIALLVVGASCALSGVAASAASNCCGSRDPADPTPALIGLVAAAGVSAAGIGLWRGRLSRGTVLLLAAALPVAVAAASTGSSDLQALLPVVVVGWFALWLYLRRRAPTEWLAARAR